MMTLQEFFSHHPKIAVALSGGVDSAFLLWAAKHCGVTVKAYYVQTAFQPRFEYDDALRLAKELDVPLQVVPLDILQFSDVCRNGSDRCYFCKKAMLGAILQAAQDDGFSVLADGTNASDDAHDRPGMKALEQLGVLSPLRLCGITKEQVRKLSREAGLFTHRKPAYACLATRIPNGTAIKASDLEKTEAAEDALKAMGFDDFRVRLKDGCAVVQVSARQYALALARWDAIVQALQPYYGEVILSQEVRP